MERVKERVAVNLNTPRVLVLNASYEPLHIASAKRAITLVQFEVAEVLEDSPDVVRSPSTVMAIPAVIRLRRYIRRPRPQAVALNRRHILRRDFFCCQYCGSEEGLTIDHVLPRSRGGGDTWQNLVTACRDCNQRKGNRTPKEAGMPLRSVPSAPTFSLLATQQGGAWFEEWRKYLY